MRPGAVDMAWTDRTMPLIELERRLEQMVPGVAEAPKKSRGVLFGAIGAVGSGSGGGGMGVGAGMCALDGSSGGNATVFALCGR